jgi:hypothetical protein
MSMNINKVCFNQNAFLIGIVILTLLILLFNNFTNNCPPCNSEIIYKKSENETETEDKNLKGDTRSVLVSTRYGIQSDRMVDDMIDKRDDDALKDPLKAPSRRLPRHIYPSAAKDYIFEVPTRGYPDNFHYYGNLIRRVDNKIVKLFGRQTYPGSNQYEYYGITSDSVGGTSVKIPIKISGDKELYDKEEIDIDFLDSSVGKFILYMNEYDRPRYNPFVIN